MSRIEQVLDKLTTLEGFYPSTPASDEAIATLEEEFGVKLPFSYRAFLKRFGVATVGDGMVAGIHNSNPHDATGSILHNTRCYRKQWNLPDNLLIIEPNEDAPYCFDTSKADAAGDYPLVCYELHNGFYKEIAPDFETWLEDFVIFRFSDSDDED